MSDTYHDPEKATPMPIRIQNAHGTFLLTPNGTEIRGDYDNREPVHCWYYVTVDEADEAFIGIEGPFWTRKDLDESLFNNPLRRGAFDIIAVPTRRST